jgi:hypothetical protein
MVSLEQLPQIEVIEAAGLALMGFKVIKDGLIMAKCSLPG